MKRYLIAAGLCLLAIAQIPKPSGSGGGSSSSSGALVLVEQQTASSSASVDINACISSTYDEYMIDVINMIPATDGATLRMRVSTDGGSSFDSGANYGWANWFWRAAASAGNGAEGSATTIEIGTVSGVGIENTASFGGMSGTMRLFSPLSTSVRKRIVGQVSFTDNSINSRASADITGSWDSTSAMNAFQFYMSSGNIASGIVRCYGIAKF